MKYNKSINKSKEAKSNFNMFPAMKEPANDFKVLYNKTPVKPAKTPATTENLPK